MKPIKARGSRHILAGIERNAKRKREWEERRLKLQAEREARARHLALEREVAAERDKLAPVPLPDLPRPHTRPGVIGGSGRGVPPFILIACLAAFASIPDERRMP